MRAFVLGVNDRLPSASSYGLRRPGEHLAIKGLRKRHGVPNGPTASATFSPPRSCQAGEETQGRSSVREELSVVLSDFRRIPAIREMSHWQDVEFEFCEAPHTRPRPLAATQQAVYLFFLGAEWLRIGQTSHSARFTSQHYATGRAPSALAQDIWKNGQEFGFGGGEQDVGAWIMQNCGRANVRMPVGWPKEVGRLLESYLHYRLRPRFEGKRR